LYVMVLYVILVVDTQQLGGTDGGQVPDFG
jgi:hypothetical protein